MGLQSNRFFVVECTTKKKELMMGRWDGECSFQSFVHFGAIVLIFFFPQYILYKFFLTFFYFLLFIKYHSDPTIENIRRAASFVI